MDIEQLKQKLEKIKYSSKELEIEHETNKKIFLTNVYKLNSELSLLTEEIKKLEDEQTN